jgi:hypothetical protein
MGYCKIALLSSAAVPMAVSEAAAAAPGAAISPAGEEGGKEATDEQIKKKKSGGKRKGTKKKPRTSIGDEEADAASIPTFCRRHGISVSTYYNIPIEARPREAVVNGRVLITREASADWRAEREAARTNTAISEE